MNTRLTRMLQLLLCLLTLAIGSSVNAKSAPFTLELDDARVALTDGKLVFETSRIERAFAVRGHDIFAESITDKRDGSRIALDATRPTSEFGVAPTILAISAAKVGRSLVSAPHLLVNLRQSYGSFETRRDCRIFPSSSAIDCVFWFRGQPTTKEVERLPPNDERAALDPNAVAGDTPRLAAVLDRLVLRDPHFSAEFFDFRIATDLRDTLVRSETTLPYRLRTYHPGSIGFLRRTGHGGTIFVVKLAPHSADQLHYPKYDFSIKDREVAVHGIGVAASELTPDAWVRGYGVAVGVASGDRRARLADLRDYTNKLRDYRPKRDSMLMSNTWGDRSRDGRMTETFVGREIAQAGVLGLTHLQLDDGWQSGLSKNSAAQGRRSWTEWSLADWAPNKQRFPNGLDGLAEAARARDVKLGFWFNPTRTDGYTLWRRDAGILVGLAERYGARSFKIDGMNIATQAADENIRNLFEDVTKRSDGKVAFNLDITADIRGGLFYLNEYGNLFLENRYTDWGNYYPYRTLRTVWTLAQFSPPQFMQVEFLNTARNPNQYLAGDPLAPATIPIDYAFATTLAAQPLAWMELSGLTTAQTGSLAKVIGTYKAIKTEFHAGKVMPIGSEPTGVSWTGFQSIVSPRTGYFVIYRENNPEGRAMIETLMKPGSRIALESLWQRSTRTTQVVGDDGRVSFSLPTAHSFDILRYVVR